MESSGQRPPDPEVPLADAAIATEIAQAAARGRGADRAPTLEQLLNAFGEPSPTPAARARVAAALRVAGMGVRPDLASAEPGQRLLLLPPGASEGRSRGRALLGVAGVLAVLVIAAAGAELLQGGDDSKDGSVAGNLPAGPTTSAPASTETTTTATTATTATETATETTTDPAATETTATDPATATTTTATTPADTTATTTPDEDDEAAAEAEAERRKRAVAAKRRREQAAARKRAAASKLVTVRVDALGRPTFLCVDNGSGTTLFSGTLDGKKVFKARRVRMNIGLKSTQITVNGNPVRLDGSPAGLDITRKGGAQPLPLGDRPCG